MATAGCGGADEPTSAADTVATARQALLDGDGEKACSQFTRGAQRQLTATLAGLAGGSPVADCDKVAGAVKRLIAPLDRSRVRNLELETSSEQAGSAVVEVVGDPGVPGAGLTVQLVKEDGRWRISGWSA